MYDSSRDNNKDIYLIPTDGGTQKRVTMHHTHDRHPSWSPDGRSLLFHSGRGGDVNIWQVEIPDLSVIDETEEDSGFCTAIVTEENIDEVDGACVATFDDEEELEPSESEDSTLPGISITSTLCLITLIAFMRRRSHV